MSDYKNKIGEINRLVSFLKERNMELSDFAKEIGVSERTLQNSVYDNNPLGPKVLRGFVKTGGSIDWLLTGKGTMFLETPYPRAVTEAFIQQKLAEDHINYEYPGSARAQRLTVFINQWLRNHSDDEQAWFEIDFKKNYQDYSEWLDKNRE